VYGRTQNDEHESKGSTGTFSVDEKSPFATFESQAIGDDSSRVGIRLARTLHKHGFPYVSVLEGGFPSLIDHLMETRGDVEPVVINHDDTQWAAFLKATGRSAYSNQKKYRPSSSSEGRTAGEDKNFGMSTKSGPWRGVGGSRKGV
jgi:hypothetical protein